MERMHPEDLRQIIAAMLAPMVTSHPETDIANGLEWAELLMTMAKPTQPEPTTGCGIHFEGRSYPVAPQVLDYIATVVEASVKTERERIVRILARFADAPCSSPFTLMTYPGCNPVGRLYIAAALTPKP